MQSNMDKWCEVIQNITEEQRKAAIQYWDRTNDLYLICDNAQYKRTKKLKIGKAVICTSTNKYSVCSYLSSIISGYVRSKPEDCPAFLVRNSPNIVLKNKKHEDKNEKRKKKKLKKITK